jgi:hypothetical protein
MGVPSTTVPKFLVKKRDELLRFDIGVYDGDGGDFPDAVQPFLVPIIREFERFHFKFAIIS